MSVKKKVRNRIPPYQLAAFRMKRYQQVKDRIRSLRSLVTSSVPPEDKPKQACARKELETITFFDKRDISSFLPKYVEFNKVTLDVDISVCLDHVISEYEKHCLERGPVSALKFFKELYNVSLRIATSNTFQAPPFTKTNSRGEPKILGPLLGLLKGTFDERKAALAALQVLKLVEEWDSDFSIETITREPLIQPLSYEQQCWVGNYFTRLHRAGRFDHTGLNLNKLRSAWFETLDSMFPLKNRDNRFLTIKEGSHIHVSGKNGPNGPGLGTVVIDHSALSPLTGSTDLYLAVRKLSALTNNGELNSILDNFDEEDYTVDHDEARRPIHSKISLKRESWGRLRPFAIVDWISQSSLRGYHDYLYRWLDSQPEDGTYRQDEVSDKVREWTAGSGDVFTSPESADLSAATDSIPLEIQTEIAEQIAGPAFAKVWRRVMGERDFKVPDSDKFVRYKRGQPMGASSSWPMLAVWHHAIARTAMRYLGIKRDPQSPSYYVIGDDIALKGQELFKVYTLIVEGLLGVGISKSKGFHMETRSPSNPLPGLGNQPMVVAELAKQVYINGREVTPVPPDEVYTSFRDPSQFKQLLFSLKRRGYRSLNAEDDVPALTRLSRDRKLALLLCSSPLDPAPPFQEGNLQLKDVFPYDRLFWFNTKYSLEELRLEFFKIIKADIIATLLSTVVVLNQWFRTAAEGGEQKVKGWSYYCETQGLVLFMVAARCKDITEASLKRLDESKLIQDGNPESWKTLKKELKRLQVIFDIELTFKGKDPIKKQERFYNNFIAKATKKLKQDLSVK